MDHLTQKQVIIVFFVGVLFVGIVAVATSVAAYAALGMIG